MGVYESIHPLDGAGPVPVGAGAGFYIMVVFLVALLVVFLVVPALV